MAREESVAVSAQDTWTNPISSKYRNPTGRVNISIEADGAWSGTITLQRKLPDVATWEDVEEYTGDIQEYLEDQGEGVVYRIGCYIGNYISGTATVRLQKQSRGA